MSELSPETKDLLERGRTGESMTPEHRARLREALSTSLALGSLGVATGSAAAWASITAKVVGALLAVGALGSAVLVLQQQPSAKRAPSAEHATARAALPPARAPFVRPSADSEQPAAPPASGRPLPTLAPMHQDEHNPPGRPVPPLARPSAARAPKQRSTEPAKLPGPSARQDARPASEASAAPPSMAPLSTLAEEALLLKEAHRASAQNDLPRALRMLDEHSARYPKSVLEPERAAQRILVLCRSGRIAEAREQTSVFLRAHPAGPLAARVGEMCKEAP